MTSHARLHTETHTHASRQDYIRAKFGQVARPGGEVTARMRRSSVFTNWFAGASRAQAFVPRGAPLRRLLVGPRARWVPGITRTRAHTRTHAHTHAHTRTRTRTPLPLQLVAGGGAPAIPKYVP